MGQYDELLTRIYTSPDDPGSFSSIENLYQRAHEEDRRIRKADVKEFLQRQRAYTLHKPYRKRFERNITVAQGIDYQWQADLVDLVRLTKANRKSRYVLTVIDVFTRYAWAVPVARKTAPTVCTAFQRLFTKARTQPKKLQTDDGLEFVNEPVGELLRKRGIEHFRSRSDHKAALVERFNRTLRKRMTTYLTHLNTQRYLRALPKLVHAYNNARHRMINMTPTAARTADESKLWSFQYGPYFATAECSKPPALQPGTKVRISRTKGGFEKGDTPNWTEEYFTVVSTRPGGKRRVYNLEDSTGEPIKGQFYEQEVQQVQPSDLFYIEKIIKKRKLRGGRVECFVKWLGWPEKFNLWIDQKEVIKLQTDEDSEDDVEE